MVADATVADATVAASATASPELPQNQYSFT
jgi:hypothetical protein